MRGIGKKNKNKSLFSPANELKTLKRIRKKIFFCKRAFQCEPRSCLLLSSYLSGSREQQGEKDRLLFLDDERRMQYQDVVFQCPNYPSKVCLCSLDIKLAKFRPHYPKDSLPFKKSPKMVYFHSSFYLKCEKIL